MGHMLCMEIKESAGLEIGRIGASAAYGLLIGEILSQPSFFYSRKKVILICFKSVLLARRPSDHG